MRDDPLVSIVILNYNGIDYLDDCLSSVFRQDYPNFELIFVDNNSSDGSIDYVRKNFPAARIIQNDKNYGDTIGNNIGMRQSKGKYIIILNPDIEVGNRWLSELVKAMEEDVKAGACMSKLLLFDKRDIINTDGNELNFLGFGWSGNYGKKDVKSNAIKEIAYPTGSALILRKSALDKVGLYDEDFFLSQEDADIGLRMRLAGYKILCNPASVAYHKYSFRGARRLYFSERDRLILLLKVFQKRTLMLILPVFIITEIGTNLYALKGGWLHKKLGAYFYLLKNLPKVFKKRLEIQRKRVVRDRQILELMRGGIYFPDVQNPLLYYILNPFLETYLKVLKNVYR